jgi:hypothetical protein
VGEFWNLATKKEKKRKIVKYVYFVLDSSFLWENNLPFFEKQCHHISTIFLNLGVCFHHFLFI